MSTVMVWLIAFVAACVLVLVGLWVASVRQAVSASEHLNGVLARLAGHAEPAPEREAAPGIQDETVMVSRLRQSIDVPDVRPVLPPRVPTTGNGTPQLLALSGHHIATRETQMSISPFTQTDVPGGSLQWSLHQATRQIEQTGHELAVARNAGVVDPTVARRALGHLVAAMTELDAVADMDVPVDQTLGGAR